MSAEIPLTFCDVAVSFSEDQWTRLDTWKKELYHNVIKEIHKVLRRLGYTIANPDVIFNIKKSNESCIRIDSSSAERKTIPSGETPDLLVRIKEETLEPASCIEEKRAYPVITSVVSLNTREEQAAHKDVCLGSKPTPVKDPPVVKQEEIDHLEQSTVHHSTGTIPAEVKQEGSVHVETQSTDHSSTEIWPVVVKQEETEDTEETDHDSTYTVVVKQDGTDCNEIHFRGHSNSTAKLLARFQNRSVEDTNLFTEEHHNLNTLRKTMSDIATIRTFLKELKEKRDIQNIPHQELDSLMSHFISVARRQDGRQYEPHTLRCMIGSLDRYLKMHKYPYNIRFGETRDFPLTRDSLNAKQKMLRKEGKGKLSKRPAALTDEDIQHLFKSGTLSMDNPTSLLNLILFNNGIHFGLRIKEQYDLQWGDIVLLTDNAGIKYLEFNEPQARIRSGENPAHIKQVKPRIYSAPRIPGGDPVAAYIKYANSRPKSMMVPESPFYLAPNVNYKPLHARWFHSMKIGINKMRRLMKEMKYDSVLPRNKKINYHSSWRPAVQKPEESVLHPTEIFRLSDHRILHRVGHYSSVAELKQSHRSTLIETHSPAVPSDCLSMQTNPSLLPSPFQSIMLPPDRSDVILSKRKRLNTVIWENCLLRNSNINGPHKSTPDPHKRLKRVM
uniref:KRAB domain-containing protein n=1 Tax=Leptobrachium leishanense TaxID=445787 RepID=A0A8C5MKF4_9ANUR